MCRRASESTSDKAAVQLWTRWRGGRAWEQRERVGERWRQRRLEEHERDIHVCRTERDGRAQHSRLRAACEARPRPPSRLAQAHRADVRLERQQHRPVLKAEREPAAAEHGVHKAHEAEKRQKWVELAGEVAVRVLPGGVA
eukprot:4943870-Pleurochrysis_carterae.AAC.2